MVDDEFDKHRIHSAVKDLAQAKRKIDNANDFIIDAEAKINEAKRRFGFKVK